jgi:hypothetical protein
MHKPPFTPQEYYFAAFGIHGLVLPKGLGKLKTIRLSRRVWNP